MQGDPSTFRDFINKNVFYPLWVVLGIYSVVMLVIQKNDPTKASYSSEERKTMLRNGAVTEAVTYNYRKEYTKGGRNRLPYVGQFISYTYFVDNQEFTIEKYELGSTNSNFDKFKEPQICRLVYAKECHAMHDINLEYFPDTISNPVLKLHFGGLVNKK
jgi:hypothetical protein